MFADIEVDDIESRARAALERVRDELEPDWYPEERV
jgi:hypothetical protein